MTPYERSRHNNGLLVALIVGAVLGVAGAVAGLSATNRLCTTECVELGHIEVVANG